MNIKILSFLTSVAEKRDDVLTIGTHNGIFHADEVLACAILCLINSNMSVQILRSRDYEMLKHCDICVDIGGGKFDHHQLAFSKTRENGIKYASAGLVWKKYGRQLIDQFLTKYFSKSESNTDSIFKSFDDSFIALVDCEDNGILEISSQTIDWVETVIDINDSTETNQINFVIFPYPNGGWAAQCVPPSFTNKFSQRISFPNEWAGQTDKLPEITGVEGATFCHNGRFFVRATSKEAITKMCNIATSSAH